MSMVFVLRIVVATVINSIYIHFYSLLGRGVCGSAFVRAASPRGSAADERGGHNDFWVFYYCPIDKRKSL